jgi:hypothetical protein
MRNTLSTLWKSEVWYGIATNSWGNSKHKQQQTLFVKLSGIHKFDKAWKVHKCETNAWPQLT